MSYIIQPEFASLPEQVQLNKENIKKLDDKIVKIGNSVFRVLGTVDNASQLPTLTEDDIGVAYMVGASEPRELYNWGYVNGVLAWSNQGTLQGPAGADGQGFNNAGNFTIGNDYVEYDVVLYNFSRYICIADVNSASIDPETDTLHWELFIGGTNPTPDAEDIVYDNTSSGLTATDVQSAIDELATNVESAEDVSYDNTSSGLTATDVQSAIDELAVNADFYGHFSKTSISTISWSNMTPQLVKDGGNSSFTIDNSGNNTAKHLTCNKAGKYLVMLTMAWDLSSSMLSFPTIAKTDSSGTYPAQQEITGYVTAYQDGGTYRRLCTVIGVLDMQVNQRIYFNIYTDGGSQTLSFKSNYTNTFFIREIK